MRKCICLSISVVVLCVGGWLFADAQTAVDQAVGSENQKTQNSEAASIVEADPTAKTTESTESAAIKEEKTEEAAAEEEPISAEPAFHYSLGIMISETPDALRAHLPIPETEGVFVQDVNPDSPAAKAGLKRYDVLTKINGQPITNIEFLQESVQKSGGKEISVTVLAHGQTSEVKITPQKVEIPAVRWGHPFFNQIPNQVPNQVQPQFAQPTEDEQDWYGRAMEWQQRQFEEMRQRMEAIEQAMPGFNQQFRAPRPGRPAFVPPMPNVQSRSSFRGFSNGSNNGNVQSFSYSVEKRNNQPAKIHINDNGKEYTVDENSLGQLPEDVRNRINVKVGDGTIVINAKTPENADKDTGKADAQKADVQEEQDSDSDKDADNASDASSGVQIQGVIDLK